MCLVVVGWQMHPEYPLIVAGNRDEFHSRPTQSAHWWSDTPDIVGGRDLQAGGTWLALHRRGRFATVTNYRDADITSAKYRSRGHLVTDFLNGTLSPVDYLKTLEGSAYAGFNLLVSDGTTLAWYSNRGNGAQCLVPGVYGLSNALLDSPWDKVVRSKKTLKDLIRENKENGQTMIGYSQFPNFIHMLFPKQFQDCSFVVGKYDNDDMFDVTAGDRERVKAQYTEAFNKLRAAITEEATRVYN